MRKSSDSAFSRQEAGQSIRRGATSTFHLSQQTTVLKTFESHPLPIMKRTAAEIQCRNYQANSLRQDLLESAKLRGVCSNTKLSQDELTEFQNSYQELCQNQDGLLTSELIKSLLENQIFPCKKDALALCKLIPKGRNGRITSAGIITASNDVTVHQRRKLQRYMRFLPRFGQELVTSQVLRPQSR
jgi:hypothetical protein